MFVNFPRLFADFHALRRLLMPRHPPCALSRLAAEISNSRSVTDNPKRTVNHNASQRFGRSTANDNYTQRILKQSNTLEPTPIRANRPRSTPRRSSRTFTPPDHTPRNQIPRRERPHSGNPSVVLFLRCHLPNNQIVKHQLSATPP